MMKRKAMKKGFTGIEIAVVLGIVAFFVLETTTPGVINSVAAIVSNTPDACGNTPYDDACVCDAGKGKTERKQFGTYGLSIFYCSGSCTVEPQNPVCSCPDGTRKVGGTPPYTCEPVIQPLPYSFPLSLDDPELNNKAIMYAQDTLAERFPSCSTDCSGDKTLEVGCSDAGFCNVECFLPITQTTRSRLWQASFLATDGSFPLSQPSCAEI